MDQLAESQAAVTPESGMSVVVMARSRRERRAVIGDEARRRVRGAPDPAFSRSLEYGAALLACFSPKEGCLGVSEFADMVGISRSTAFRYAATFSALGWLEHGPHRRYRLASGAVDPGLSVLRQIVVRTGASRVLETLRELTRCTASLLALDGSRATYVARLHAHGRGQYDADMGLRAGAHVPLHCTAAGKALLASLSDEMFVALLDQIVLERHTTNTLTSKRALSSQIVDIIHTGVALADEELAPGVRGTAAFVGSEVEGHRLALEVNAPAERLSIAQLTEDIAPLVSKAVAQVDVEVRLGKKAFEPLRPGHAG